MRLIDEILAPVWSLHRLVRGRIEDDRPALLAATRTQELILNRTRSVRRLEVVGPAGSGKSMLAAEKARRLAREGYRTLLVCFNSRLATSLIRELEDAPAPGGLDVTTFHRLCERLGAQAGVLPPRPEPIPQAWWDDTLPSALEAAIAALPGTRYHAIVVDEGQDFESRWFVLLQRLLTDPDDVFWVFHDPGQALFRADVVADLGLQPHQLFENLRNPESVAQLAARFYRGGEEPIVMRETGRRHAVIDAEPGPATLEALRKTLHRLIEEERVPPWKIAVLSGESATSSIVWQRRRFGNAVLANEALLDDGRSKGLAPEDVPEEPDEVLFETIRRFKGMEREVVVLVELPTEGDRLDELLYVGLTRATTELVVIAPPDSSGDFDSGAAPNAQGMRARALATRGHVWTALRLAGHGTFIALDSGTSARSRSASRCLRSVSPRSPRSGRGSPTSVTRHARRRAARRSASSTSAWPPP